MAARYEISTRHSREMIRRLVACRAVVLTPSAGLQRALIAACCVAVGFLFAPGPMRYAGWGAGAAVLAWHLISPWITARILHARDPFARAGEAERVTVDARGFTGDHVQIPWPQVVRVLDDGAYWFVWTRTGTILALDQAGLDGGATPSRLAAYMSEKSGAPVRPLDGRISARLRDTQARRRGYVDENPGLTARIVRSMTGPKDRA
ncbi:MAG: hypothetical protein Q4G21_03500 [Dermabacter sp.]|nr:hypothetical protein [Dermabacter sp.]